MANGRDTEIGQKLVGFLTSCLNPEQLSQLAKLLNSLGEQVNDVATEQHKARAYRQGRCEEMLDRNLREGRQQVVR